MKYLLDTQLLLWAATESEKLSRRARALLRKPENELIFSAASIWEIAIKASLGRKDFRIEPRVLRRGFLDNGYFELPITSEHAVGTDRLSGVHKDPFDRILISQAITEGITLLTTDERIARYDGPIKKV